MADYVDMLFELGTEELPPVALRRLSESLVDGFHTGLEQAGLQFEKVEGFATPRRMAVKVIALQRVQPERAVERRGPALKAAYDGDGKPTKALQGFARSCGVEPEALEQIETPKGTWLVFRSVEPGKQAIDLLPAIARQSLEKLPIPKRMRWGSSDTEFVRPVHWLLFMLGSEVVPCTLLDAQASNLTYGHRFHSPEAITIDQPGDYVEALQKARVLVDLDQRSGSIRKQVEAAAAKLDGEAVIDEGLLAEVTALVEWPVAISGGFEKRFLEVPQEALILTMKKNQKYFHLVDRQNKLLPYFITISNIESSNPDVISEGNERVIRPRLADAMFFWEQDGKKSLADLQDSLDNVVFQIKLGNLREKSRRVANLASEIAGQIDGDPELAHRAGLLSRCDLMTEMVNEFADMQGIMGRYQAQRSGEPEELAQAMDEFYMPRFSGDQLPQTRSGIAIALAERLDTLVGIFGIGQKPTGDKDPYALRRAALGALRIMEAHKLPLNLWLLLESAANGLQDRIDNDSVAAEVHNFMLDRLKGLYHDRGIPSETFDAVAAVSPKSIADFDRRIDAVLAFTKLDAAEALAAANKRTRNILKKAGDLPRITVDSNHFEQDEETTLFDQLTKMQSQIDPLLVANDYEQTLITLAELREPVDRFFDSVMVMADEAALRNNRLAILQALEALFLKVADISRLQV
ncbi:MAG: glycine--tRNA ligase subunit beta [Gammaproteobacteria bacterium]|nr:glycine--tRNA ligase subunit beta [Gammaproteobacteria bacterium]